MFARLFMFSFVVFFAHSALASPKEVFPKVPNDRRVEKIERN